jgi:hypothetical protein
LIYKQFSARFFFTNSGFSPNIYVLYNLYWVVGLQFYKEQEIKVETYLPSSQDVIGVLEVIPTLKRVA